MAQRRRGPVPGISRIDQESTRTHGYYARVGYSRGRDGRSRPKHVAFFGDASHGGRKKALAAAEEWVTKAKKSGGKRGASAASKKSSRKTTRKAAKSTRKRARKTSKRR